MKAEQEHKRRQVQGMKLSRRRWGAGGHPSLDLILASRDLLALPVVRCLLFIFCPELPLSQAPAWLCGGDPISLSLSRPELQPFELLFSKAWFSAGRRWGVRSSHLL